MHISWNAHVSFHLDAYYYKCCCRDSFDFMHHFQIERIVDQRQKLSPGVEVLNIKIHRDTNGGLGLSIAGGLESTPYKVSLEKYGRLQKYVL